MNAGCYGGETWRYVARVEVVTRGGAIAVEPASRYATGYRTVRRADGSPPDAVFTAAWFAFPRGDGRVARERIAELLRRRIATQPLNLPNAGSVFRNPPGDHAARLIESCGLKGYAIGGARVSEKHANFIVNPDGAARGRRHRSDHRARPVDGARANRCRSRSRSADHRRRMSRKDSFGKVAVLMGGPSAEREISLLSGNAVLKALVEKGVDAHAFDPKERPILDLKARRLRSRLHRAPRTFRRGRHRAGRARDAGHPLHGQRRHGLRARDGQVANEARLDRERHSDAALSRRRRSHRLDAHRRRARAAAHREARARGLDDRHHESGHRRRRRARARPTTVAARHDDLVLVEEFVAGVEADRVDPRRRARCR